MGKRKKNNTRKRRPGQAKNINPRRVKAKTSPFTAIGIVMAVTASAACVAIAAFALLSRAEAGQSAFVENVFAAVNNPSESHVSYLSTEEKEYDEILPPPKSPEICEYPDTYDYPEPYKYCESYKHYKPYDYPEFYEYPENTHASAFSVLPFYIPENADAYAAFQRAMPDLDVETIVWKVNVSLHLPFFSEIQTNYNENPIFITPFFRLPPGFTPSELTPVNSDTCWLRATPATVAAFRKMRDAAQVYGYNLVAVSAFRTAARQEYLWESRGRRDGATARPYHSEHQTGRALDLGDPDGRLLDSTGTSPTGIWVAANVHYFGFIVRYPAGMRHITGYIHEPWHITYVGIDISMYMHEHNILSLEEFVGRNPEGII